jgi:hypothetical protein
VTTLSYHPDSITYNSKNILDYSDNDGAQGDEFINEDKESFSTSRESLNSDITSTLSTDSSNNFSLSWD